MKLEEGAPADLTDRAERECAKLARIARGDTVHGGARAMVIAKRANAMGCRFPADEVVSEVYSLSNWTCGRFGVYRCPECGQSYLGMDAAYNCCSMNKECESE